MKIHDVEQNSEAWYHLRAGTPTASQWNKLLTPAKLEPSRSRFAYTYELAGETLAGEPLERSGGSSWTERGHHLEPEAREEYRAIANMPVDQVGFVTRDLDTAWNDGGHSIGASPDALVGTTGLLEIKCLAFQNHLSMVDEFMQTGDFPHEFRIQVQGQIYVTGRAWCDLWLYHPHPKIPNVRIHAERDDELIQKLEPQLLWVLDQRDRIVERMRDQFDCAIATDSHDASGAHI